MDQHVLKTVKKWNLVSRIEGETGKPLPGIKKAIINNLSAKQLQEFAEIIYAEVGPLGYERDLIGAVPVVKAEASRG
jgi:hypothetical protein